MSDSEIPKTIHTLWLQGEEHAPMIVKGCLDYWRKLNPGYLVRVYSARDVEQCLLEVGGEQKFMTPQAKSDIFRLWLLHQHGGVWVDSTTLPLLPLDKWLPIATRSGFLLSGVISLRLKLTAIFWPRTNRIHLFQVGGEKRKNTGTDRESPCDLINGQKTIAKSSRIPWSTKSTTAFILTIGSCIYLSDFW